MKVIENIPLLKKLQPFLGETEYWIIIHSEWYDIELSNHIWIGDYKTVHLEEAIELLPSRLLNNSGVTLNLLMDKSMVFYYSVSYDNEIWLEEQKIEIDFEWAKLLEAIEKMLEYLIDNNLMK